MTPDPLLRWAAPIAIALVAAAAHAQDTSVLKFDPPATPDARTMPDPERRPQGPLDFGFAITEICYPFVIDQSPAADISQHAGAQQLPEHTGRLMDMPQHGVTLRNNSPLLIFLREPPFGRTCTIQVNDPGVVPTPDLLAAAREWPTPLTVVRAPVYDDIDGAMSTMLCGVNEHGGEDLFSMTIVALEPDFKPLSLEFGFLRSTEPEQFPCDPDYYRVGG